MAAATAASDHHLSSQDDEQMSGAEYRKLDERGNLHNDSLESDFDWGTLQRLI
jgi:hypothetical protein